MVAVVLVSQWCEPWLSGCAWLMLASRRDGGLEKIDRDGRSVDKMERTEFEK